jgi:hypothetical protein
MNQYLGDSKFEGDGEVEEVMTRGMELRTRPYYQQGTNCCGGGCVENEWDGSTVNFEPLSLKLEINIDRDLFPDRSL